MGIGLSIPAHGLYSDNRATPFADKSGMYLRLTLPPRSSTPASGLVTRLAEVERWLTSLPMLNLAETTHHLARYLTGLNRSALDDRQRLQILELLRTPVEHVSQGLARTYVGLPLPLTDKARHTTEQVRELQTEMAYGYKLVTFNSTAMARLDDRDKAWLAVAMQRAIRYLTALLFRHYEIYTPPPEGTWYEIHQLYRYAETINVVGLAVTDKLNITLPQSSVGHAYKQALLLDFSDPYHLPARLLDRIHHYLDRYASLATLTPGVVALKPQCQFLINLDNDRAGAINAGSSPITTEVRYRLLNTTELARTLHQQFQALTAGQQPEADGLDKDFFRHIGFDLLARLINAWGVNPKRIFTRQERTGRRMDAVFGVEAINYFVNGAERFCPSTNEVGPMPRNYTPGIAGGAHNRVKQAETVKHSLWGLADESAGGYALAHRDAPGEPVRVGDLMAARSQEDGGWETGSVRWVRASGTDGVEIGIQRMAPNAGAVAIMAVDDPQERYFLALALPEVKALKQPPTLVTARGFFKPGRLLSLDNGYRTRQVRASTLLELTGAFERFQYEFIGS